MLNHLDGKRDQGGIFLLCQKEAKALKNSRHSQIPVENGKTFSDVLWDLQSILKDKRSTWQQSCTESLNREQEVLCLAEETKAQGSVDENTRVTKNSRTQTHEEDWERGRVFERLEATRRPYVEGTREISDLLGC